MEVWQIILLFAGIVFILWGLPLLLVPYFLYRALLVRTSPKKWSRECSKKDDEHLKMYAECDEWEKRYLSFKQEVSIQNEGFKLYGEYMNFGHKKAVIIIAGRSEGCKYCYYFAEPYRKAGYNVLV